MQTEQTVTPATVFPAVRLDGEIGYPINRLVRVFDDRKRTPQSLTINGGHATHFLGRFAVHTFSP